MRPASGSSPDTGRCSITVQLWYPAEPETGVRPAPYDFGNEGFLSVKRWVKTGAKLDAAVAAAQARFPILLYFPEWDGVPTPYAAMARGNGVPGPSRYGRVGGEQRCENCG